MKLGVIADVHGNDVALRAVLDDAAGYHVDAICAGAVIPTPPSSRQSSPANATSSGSVRTPGCPSCA